MFVDTIIIIFCGGCCLISFFFSKRGFPETHENPPRYAPDFMKSSNTAQSMPPSVNHVLNHLICTRVASTSEVFN